MSLSVAVKRFGGNNHYASELGPNPTIMRPSRSTIFAKLTLEYSDNSPAQLSMLGPGDPVLEGDHQRRCPSGPLETETPTHRAANGTAG